MSEPSQGFSSYTPLVFNDTLDASNMQNILFVDSNVNQSQILYDSANDLTFPIMYSYDSTRADLESLLNSKFSTIDRIAFAFENTTNDKPFLNQEYFFIEADLVEGATSFSPNLQMLIDIINKYSVKNIDFLACYSLNYPNWVNYYDLLTQQTSVIVGASSDATGNLQYGGDWVMENTNENVINTYFNDNIQNYTSLLAVIIDLHVKGYLRQDASGIIQYQEGVTTGSWTSITSWPCTIHNQGADLLVMSLYTDISINAATNYFITGKQNITFDSFSDINDISQNKTIFINVANYPGFIQNGTAGGGGNGVKDISVQNIAVVASSSASLAAGGGWICQSYFGHNALNNVVNNCYSTGNIATGRGGICGSNNGAAISNCYSTGVITTQTTSGGICGPTNVGTITNCYTLFGLITPSGGTGTISNCYTANGTWSDTTANANLTGTPSSGNNYVGTSWSDISLNATNVPYILSYYNANIYSIPIVSPTILPYNSSAGLFTPGYTYKIISIYSGATPGTLYTTGGITINSSTGVITFATSVVNTKYVVYVLSAKYNANNRPYSYNYNTFTANSVSCFNHDTKFLCLNKELQEEYIPIQNLRKGDLVKSYLHGYRRILYIGTDKMYNDPNNLLGCMCKLEKTEDNGLTEDLIITGGHSILVDKLTNFEDDEQKSKFNFDQEIDNKKLLLACISAEFKALQDNNKYTYYQFCLEDDGDEERRFGVWGNGMLTEINSKKWFITHPYDIIN